MRGIKEFAAVAAVVSLTSAGAAAMCLPPEEPEDDDLSRTAALECDPVSGECADIPSGPVYAMHWPLPDDWPPDDPWPLPWPPQCPHCV